jgi:putative SOS response-associated peptidase YedK
MRAWPVSDRVGNVRNNDPELLEEASAPAGPLFT